MRGEQVIVRSYGDKPLLRNVWGVGKDVVYITRESQCQRTVEHGEQIDFIGFPREDVFQYDPQLAASMEKLYREGKWNWDELTPWKGN